MKTSGYMINIVIFLQLVVYISWMTTQVHAMGRVCGYGPCLRKTIWCPEECPWLNQNWPGSKSCYIDCQDPKCQSECRRFNGWGVCERSGAACYDPRFIGKGGVVFYFHGKSNEHFSLVSDTNLQINARFIGHRPAGRTRDYTWIQALGILFNSHSVSLEATKLSKWDDEIDHLKFTYDGQEVFVAEGTLAEWISQYGDVKIKRFANKNGVILSIPQLVEVTARVVPVTEEENRVHNYQLPSDDCFAHLEVSFNFLGVSSNVDGVIGRTYRPDFENPAKLGVAMPTFGGEDKYRTTSLFSADCKDCLYDPNSKVDDRIENPMLLMNKHDRLDCSSGSSRGNGIVCKK